MLISTPLIRNLIEPRKFTPSGAPKPPPATSWQSLGIIGRSLLLFINTPPKLFSYSVVKKHF